MRIEQLVREGDFHEQRKSYRSEALRNLREREGIPVPELVDGRMQYLQADGSYSGMATGKVRGLPISEVEQFWGEGSYPAFETLEVGCDGTPIEREIVDLTRDAALVEQTQGVRFEGSEPWPDLVIEDTSDEAEVDSAIQRIVEQGN